MRDALKIIQLRPWHSQVRDRAKVALDIPLDGSALKRAKQEVLLKAASEIDKCSFGDMAELVRKMAKDLE